MNKQGTGYYSVHKQDRRMAVANFLNFLSDIGIQTATCYYMGNISTGYISSYVRRYYAKKEWKYD